jgi:hypothetical protein
MTHTLTAVRPTLFVDALRALHVRMIVVLGLAVSQLTTWAAAQQNPPAASAATAAGLNSTLDAKARIVCGYVAVLPNSKWVTLGALIFFLVGIGLMIFGGRGGNVFLFRAIGAVVLIPAAVALASAFGIAC